MRRLNAIGAALCVLLTTAACSGTGDDEPGAWEGRTPRILVLGDSLSHGRAGDVTWRGRLSAHLAEVGQDVDFVGPRKGVQDPMSYVGVSWPESPQYGGEPFDSHHASRWGQAVGFLETSPTALVGSADPDVVVIELGINDLAWRGTSAAEVTVRLESLVRLLQKADPTVSIVLCNLPATEVPGAVEVNGSVSALSEDLSTEQSQVVVAEIDGGYDKGVTWDGLHPNARGESLIARGVAEALDELGIGAPMEGMLADPTEVPAGRPTLEARAGRSVHLAWDEVVWADGYHVMVRPAGSDDSAWQWAADAAGNGAVLDDLKPGQSYDVAVQPFRGTLAAPLEQWSEPVSVELREGSGEAPTAPATPATRVTPDGVRLAWSGDARDYWVWVRSAEVDSVFDAGNTWRVHRTSRPWIQLDSLVPGLAYEAAVQAVGEGTSSPLSATTGFVVDGPRPRAPAIEVENPGVAGAAVLAWDEVVHADRYDIWYRLVGKEDDTWEAYNSAGILTTPRVTLLGLVPGARYEVVVKPFNGALEGEQAATSFVAAQ